MATDSSMSAGEIAAGANPSLVQHPYQKHTSHPGGDTPLRSVNGGHPDAPRSGLSTSVRSIAGLRSREPTAKALPTPAREDAAGRSPREAALADDGPRQMQLPPPAAAANPLQSRSSAAGGDARPSSGLPGLIEVKDLGSNAPGTSSPQLRSPVVAPAAAPKKQRIDTRPADGLRGLAALHVALGHFVMFSRWGPDWAAPEVLAPPPAVPGPAGVCPLGWDLVNGRCFELFCDRVSSAAAERHCRGVAWNARLAAISDADQFDAVVAGLRGHFGAVWTGPLHGDAGFGGEVWSEQLDDDAEPCSALVGGECAISACESENKKVECCGDPSVTSCAEGFSKTNNSGTMVCGSRYVEAQEPGTFTCCSGNSSTGGESWTMANMSCQGHKLAYVCSVEAQAPTTSRGARALEAPPRTSQKVGDAAAGRDAGASCGAGWESGTYECADCWELEWDLQGSGSMGLFYIISGFVMGLGYGQSKLRASRPEDAGKTVCCQRCDDVCCQACDAKLCNGCGCCGPDVCVRPERPEDDTGKLFDSRGFLRKRLARLAPMYYGSNILFLCIMLLAGAASLEMILPGFLSIFVLTSWVGLQPINGVCWTISTMFFYYLVFPAMIPRMQRIQKDQLRCFAWKMFVIQMIAMNAASGGVFWGSGIGNEGWFYWFSRAFPPFRVPVFVMGICCAFERLELNKKRAAAMTSAYAGTTSSMDQADPRAYRGSRFSADFLFVVWFAAMLGAMCAGHWVPHYVSIPLPSFPRWHLEWMLPMLFYHWIMALTDPGLATGNSWAVRLFNTRPFQFIGEISMSFYMLHILPCILLAMVIGGDHGPAGGHMGGPAWSIAVLLPFSIALGWAATNHFEKPMAAWIRGEGKLLWCCAKDETADVADREKKRQGLLRGILPSPRVSRDSRRASSPLTSPLSSCVSPTWGGV